MGVGVGVGVGVEKCCTSDYVSSPHPLSISFRISFLLDEFKKKKHCIDTHLIVHKLYHLYLCCTFKQKVTYLHSSGSQDKVLRFINIVLEAFVTSVMWIPPPLAPPVMF